MRYFIDTEFNEDGKTIELISIGIAREDGATLYLVSAEFDPTACSDWVKENVLPKLGDASRMTRKQIADEILWFVRCEKPEFWGYFADYDWVVLCQLFGRMIDLPKGFPMFCMDLKQWGKQLGVNIKEAVPKPSDAHNAIADAMWMRDVHAYLASLP